MQITPAATKQEPTPYASPEDLCRVFQEDMTGLYLLAFLLTVDRQKAEECFVSGLEDSSNGNHVFREWARSWARHTVIRNALRLIEPRPVKDIGGVDAIPAASNEQAIWRKRFELPAVLKLPAFERFVFVMSVLHGYSDQDCSVLLGCTRRDVVAARTRVGLMPEFVESSSQTTQESADESLLYERGCSGKAQVVRI